MSSKRESIQLARYQQIDEQLFAEQEEHKQHQNRHPNTSNASIITGGSCILVVIFVFVAVHYFIETANSMVKSNSSPNDHSDIPTIAPKFDENGRFIMYNYDQAKPMSSFLPGLGGIWGVPMWAFYNNRGQGITAFGVDNKDGGIAKFNTAEKAYQQTPFTGFRTFLKGKIGEKSWMHMPFFPHTGEECTTRRDMSIGMNELEINEVDESKELETNVLYFTVPDESFPALVRRVTITNRNSESSLSLEVLDGLTKLEPSGIPNGNLDAMGRTMEAWMNVYNMDNTDRTLPFYHASQGTADTAEVQVIREGHYALAYIEGVFSNTGERIADDDSDDDDFNPSKPSVHISDDPDVDNYDLLPFVVDPNVVFGTDTSLVSPSKFFSKKSPAVHDLIMQPQGTTSRTPCAYAGASVDIPPGGSVVISSIYGHASSSDEFFDEHVPKLRRKGFIPEKYHRARELVHTITKRVNTNTSSELFNAYIRQNFLDNVLRGGLPIALGDIKPHSKPKIYHVFSRIHGDLERDYNFFNIETTYFSQGPGNFRDVNQNRRNDVIHSPVVGDFNVRMFLSFIQTDGYNPLTVSSTLFSITPSKAEALYTSLGMNSTLKSKWVKMVSNGFRIGQLLKDMKANGMHFPINRDDFVDRVVAASDQTTAGIFAQNGFWTDHWTYTLDLIKSYLFVFPDKEVEMMYDADPIPFFMSPAVVKPRKLRYVLVDDPMVSDRKTVRVYNAVSIAGDPSFPSERAEALHRIYHDPRHVAGKDNSAGIWQRCQSGEIFTVSPITKLAMLAVIKFSTMDPFGMGVEMEGGKPGWNDAMNGLPGILGSEMSETYEMLQIVRYLQRSFQRSQRNISFPIEFSDFMDSISSSLEHFAADTKKHTTEQAEFNHWDRSNSAREIYRERTVGDVSCTSVTWSVKKILELLDAIERKTNDGISRALETNNGLPPTYFYYECVEYTVQKLPAENITVVRPNGEYVFPKKFALKTLPLFLEGPVRHMKTSADVEENRQIYMKVKQSELFDPQLKMFKISGSLVGMRQEIGRMMAFSPGWLENESVWLHMSYKFYLELLRAKLYDAFYHEISTGLVPFMDSDVFGRSPLEAASFIVSTAFPDSNLHGASFLARLSGSTAEFMSMWTIMTQGHEPFFLNEHGEVNLRLNPVLARWLFSEGGVVSFTFLGDIKVTYYNYGLLDTWNINPTYYVVRMRDGKEYKVNGSVVGTDLTLQIRDLKVDSIDVYLE